MRRNLIRLACVALFTLSCGYALVGRGANIPADVKRVYLKPFENETSRVRVDQILTQALADELVNRQSFAIVASAAEADAELAGTVTSFNVEPVRFDSDRRGVEFEISLTAKVGLRRLSPDAVLWQNDRYQFRDSFPLDASELGFLDRETPAIETAAKRFAETMVTDLLEGF